jgi:hypothetical protein
MENIPDGALMTMTYTSLVNDIQTYLQRTDAETIAKIPTFIFLAENVITAKLQSLGIVQVVNGVFIPGVNGGAVLQKPGGWRRTISFNIGTGEDNETRTILQPREYEFLIDYWPNRNEQAVPEFYADYDFSHWLIAPTPDEAYPFEISYVGMPQPLSINSQTNWLTNYAPHVLLYGSLLQAQGFVRNMEMVPLWTQWYTDGIQDLIKQEEARITDRSTKRDSISAG